MGVLAAEPVQGHAGRAGRVPALDGIRGIAVLLVMAFHLDPVLVPGGAVGVDIFFVLSGFLITDILLAERASTHGVDLTAFYIRRAARLLPALLVFLLVLAPPIAVLAGHGDDIVPNSLVTLTYLSDFARGLGWPVELTEPYGHTWSLAVEEQFYVIWPFVLVLALRRRVPMLAIGVGLWCTGVAATLITSRLVGTGQDYFLPSGHLHALAIGCVVALGLHAGHNAARWWTTPLALLAIPATVLATVLDRDGWPWWSGPLTNVVFMLPVACLVGHAASRQTRITAALAVPALVWCGHRSYAIYLFHRLFGATVHDLPIGGRTWMVVGYAATFVLAEISFRLVEDPIMRRTRAWLRRTR